LENACIDLAIVEEGHHPPHPVITGKELWTKPCAGVAGWSCIDDGSPRITATKIVF
jgi:hypothetical protein